MILQSDLPVLDQFGPEAALFLFAGWLAWEVYAPRILGVNTAFSPIFDMPERMNDMESQLEDNANRLEDMEAQQTHHIQATRANARALDDRRSVTIDSERIDDYLINNGVPMSAFTQDERDGMASDGNENYTDAEQRGEQTET
jgi:hypothetical protein